MSVINNHYQLLQDVLSGKASHTVLQNLPVLAHFERTGEVIEIDRQQVAAYKANNYKVIDVFSMWLDGRKQAANRRIYR